MSAREEGSMNDESKTPSLPEDTSIRWYQALVDNMNEGFGIIDETGVFTYVNKRFGDLLGYEPNEMVGHSIFDFLEESQAEVLCSTLEKRREGISSQYELEWTTSSGTNIPTLVSGAPLFDKNNNHMGSFAAITDISAMKENQEKIRKSRKIYRTLFEESPIGIIRLNANGDILDANRTALELLGYESREDRLEININEHPKLKDSEINRQYQRALTEKESFTGRLEYKSTKGRNLYVRYKLHPIIDETGSVSEILVAFDDISALRSSDLALRASEEKYRTLAESSLQGLSIIQDDHYVYVNHAFANMVGYSVEEILSMTKEKQWALIHPDDQNYLLKLSENRKAGKAVPQPYQYRFVTKDGEVRWVEAFSGYIDYEGKSALQVLIIDITERKKAQEAVRESEQKYKTLAEQSIQGITVLKDDGIAYANKTFAEMVGYSLEELYGRSLEEAWELIHPDDRELLRQRIEARSEGKEVGHRSEYRLVTKDGKAIWVESFASRIDYEGTSAIQTVHVDISERRQAEKQSRTAKDRADLYLDILSHDVRNMLQVIMNSATLLRDADDQRARDSFLKVIDESVHRCSRLIEEVRASEDFVLAPLQKRSLKSALEACISGLAKSMHQVDFRLSLEDDAIVLADVFLELLLTNILTNAVEHNTNDEKSVWVSLKASNGGYLLSIADNGPGIKDARKDKLFNMARRFGGVGLHQANQIIEKYGGRIAIHDRVLGDYSQGAEFRVWFPKPPH